MWTSDSGETVEERPRYVIVFHSNSEDPSHQYCQYAVCTMGEISFLLCIVFLFGTLEMRRLNRTVYTLSGDFETCILGFN